MNERFAWKARGQSAGLGILLLLLGACFLLSLEGCSATDAGKPRGAGRRPGSFEPSALAGADLSGRAGDRGQGGPQESAEEEPAPDEPSEPPEPEPPQAAPRGRGRLTPDEMIRLMGLDQESRRIEARELVKQARADRANLDARRAEERLEHAVRLDPQNEEARRLLSEVRTILGDPRGTVAQVAEYLTEERRVAIKQAQAEVRNAINSGARHEEAKEFDAAIRDYEKAIQLVRGFPFNLELDEELNLAQKRLESARLKKKEHQEDERRLLEARIRDTRRAELASSVNLLQNRVRELRRKARDAWDRQEYEEVEEIAAQILAVLPEDADASALAREAREERHVQTQHKIMVNQIENHQRVLLGLDESSITYQRIFRYPSGRDWQRLQPKVVTIEERALAEESAGEKELKRKLEEKYTIEFREKTPLPEALKSLTSFSGINFILTKDAQAAVRDESIGVQIPLMREAPLRSILNLLLAAAGDKNFQYTIESGAVVIGSKEDLKDKLKLYTEFYDINDVTQPHPDYPAPPLALQEMAGTAAPGGGLDVGGEEEEAKGAGTLEVEKLIELITKELRDESDELIGREPKVQSGKLMIQTTLENHQKVQRLLQQLRKASGIMVTVESRFLDIQENFLEEIGVDMGNPSNTFLPNSIPDIDGAGTSIDPGYEFTNRQQDFNARTATLGGLSQTLGSRVNPFNISSSGGGAYQLNIFDAEKFQLEAILVGVGKEQSIRRLNSPRVTAFNTQVSHTLVINQAAYIQDLEVNQTGVIPVINPVIGILNSGSILEVRPTVSFDRKYVVLEIQPTLAERLQPEVAELSLSGNFTVVPIELPVLSVTKIKTTVTIPDGGTVLVGGLKREIRNESSMGIPGLRRIPILNLLFGRKGEAALRSNLFVLINAKIIVVQEEEERLFNT